MPRVIFNPHKVRKGFRYWVLASLLATSRKYLLNMIDFSIDENSIILDMGCNIGYLTRPLSFFAETVGLDVDRETVRRGKKFNRHIEFVCCDLCHLPLRNASAKVAVCGSVFEHLENLDKALKEIKFVLKKRGMLAAGYPIETKLLEFVFRFFCKSESTTWNQCSIVKHESKLNNPHAHKQTFSDIRNMLRQNFSLLRTRKIPINCFPDFLSIYEVMLARNKNEKEGNEKLA